MGKSTHPSGDTGSDPGGAGGLFYVVCVFMAFASIYRATLPLAIRVKHFYGQHLGQILAIFHAFLISVFCIGGGFLWNRYLKRTEERFVTQEDEESVFLGHEVKNGQEVHLKAPLRTMHTQLIGTTNSGKTASVILPWAVRDIQLGHGLILIDGKSDGAFLNQLYAQAVEAGRESDFLVFSLARPNISATFNPFCHGTSEQIAERVFSAFEFKDEYYRGIQFSALRTLVALLMRRGQVAMPGVIRELLRDQEVLKGWLDDLEDENLAQDVLKLTELKKEEFQNNFSGLVMALGHFSQGDTSVLFNTRHPEIVLSEVLKHKKICYVQLPTMQFPFLGAATGKLFLQSLQSAISELQVHGEGRLKSLFSVYLDDFNDYIYEGFASLLNKSRSANIGVVFAHQSLGDLEKVSSDFKTTVITNTNIKIVMRSNDPESAEHFAKMIGTKSSEKTTERRQRKLIGHTDTGDQSVRNVEEYRIHPNVFKSELGRGEGIVIIPHVGGQIAKRIKFMTVPTLPTLRLRQRDLPQVNFVTESLCGGVRPETPDSPTRTEKIPTQEKNQTNPYKTQSEVEAA